MSGAAHPPGWEDVLDPDERILWQGAPDASVTVGTSNVLGLLFGLAFAGFALVWMVTVSTTGAGAFALFALPHLLIGIGIAAGAVLTGPFRRRRTFYTLTDRRAFVAVDLPVVGRNLESYPITPDTSLRLAGADPQSLWFATRRRRRKNGWSEVDVGFERLHDATAVMRLMRDIQRGELEVAG